MDTIGFVGLGLMGGSIMEAMRARNVPCIVFDIDPAAMAAAIDKGAIPATSPLDLANRAETLFACLPSPAICQAVAVGKDGVIGGCRIRRYVELSTMGRPAAMAMAAAFAQRGIDFVDAPVSGGVEAAREGKLTSMLAGAPEALAAIRPLVDLYSTVVFEVGPHPGSAQLVKLINNAIAIFGSLLTFEGFAVADKAGIDKAVLTAVLNVSSGANFASRVMAPVGLISPEPRAVGRAEIFSKDIEVYMEEASDLDLALPVASHLAAITRQVGADPDMDVVPALRAYFNGAIDAEAPLTRSVPERSDRA